MSLLPAAPQLALFMGSVLLLNATPGVDMLLTASRTLQHGPAAGAAAALGIGTGCAVHALAAAFGLAALLAATPAAFAALQWLGAAYLLWLGLGLLRSAWRGTAAAAAAAPEDGPAAGVAAHFRAGLLTNLLNPKVALFFLAFLPQFIAPQADHKTAAFLALGAVAVLQGTLFLLLLVLALRSVKDFAQSSWQRRGLQGLAGVSFLVLALKLAINRPALA